MLLRESKIGYNKGMMCVQIMKNANVDAHENAENTTSSLSV